MALPQLRFPGMRLTTKGRYAVTAMLDLALHGTSGPVALAAVAQRQGISQPYLEQLFVKLRQAGLVRGVRGPGGGFLLGDPPAQIDLAAIVDAVDEHLEATRCGGAGNCQDGDQCLTHAVWTDLSERIRDFLCNITLSDLVQRQEIRRVDQRQRAGSAERITARTL